MRVACIDIGSNTTRLLVAERIDGTLHKLEQRRSFTHLRRGLDSRGAITPAKLAEVVAVVGEQLALAARLQPVRIAVVGTAALRRAANAHELVEALERDCRVRLEVISEEEEARLAFVGACAALAEQRPGEPPDRVGVVDVGGGSSELVVGMPPHDVDWSASRPLGSGDLADACFVHDPPGAPELDAARAQVAAVLGSLSVPRPNRALAVGGSAASLLPLAGARLDAEAFGIAMALLLSAPSAEIARRFALDPERVRLLPAGVLILHAAQERFGVPLELVGGGLREGVLMELGDE